MKATCFLLHWLPDYKSNTVEELENDIQGHLTGVSKAGGLGKGNDPPRETKAQMLK